MPDPIMSFYKKNYSHHLLFVFVYGDINTSCFYKIKRFFNCQVIKKGKRIMNKYLIC